MSAGCQKLSTTADTKADLPGTRSPAATAATPHSPTPPRQAQTREEDAMRQAAEASHGAHAQRPIKVADLHVETDEVDQFRWFTYPLGSGSWINSDRGSEFFTSFGLYIGQRTTGGPPLLRVQAIRGGTNRLFLDRFTVVADGQRFEHQGHFKRNGRWEVFDEKADAAMLTTLRAVIAAEQAVVRFRGDNGTDDHTFTAQQKAMLQDMLNAYQEMGGK